MRVRRCTLATVRRPLALNTFQKMYGRSDARRLSVRVSLPRCSIQPVLSLAVIDGEVFVLLSKQVRDTTGHKTPLLLLLLPKCKFIIIMISATICAISNHLSAFAPCLHLSTRFNRATPGLCKPHSRLRRRPGERRAFLLSEYHVSLTPSCSLI